MPRHGTATTSRAIALLSLVGATVALGCPLGPFPGGRLRGPVDPPPRQDWSFVRRAERCQLETNPDDPHSINCWCVGWGSRVYVPTSMIRGPLDPAERGWVKNVESESEVRLRVDGRIYELDAVRVPEGGDEYDEVLAALEEKYGLDPAERDPEREIWIYRLEPR